MGKHQLLGFISCLKGAAAVCPLCVTAPGACGSGWAQLREGFIRECWDPLESFQAPPSTAAALSSAQGVIQAIPAHLLLTPPHRAQKLEGTQAVPQWLLPELELPQHRLSQPSSLPTTFPRALGERRSPRSPSAPPSGSGQAQLPRWHLPVIFDTK